MSLRFKKTKEDFVCEHCGTIVVGNGFTNHCPQCLYSKHVDEFPGDRAGECKGLMEPVSLLLRRKEYAIVHRCLRCGEEITTKTMPGDNLSALLDKKD